MTERRMVQLEDVAIAWWMVFVYAFTALAGDLSPADSWIVVSVLFLVCGWAGFATIAFLRG